jgi:glycosyltransferase involved in cell wall biosynthesis
MPKVSVIIPTYNRAWCIERAIKSVIVQSFKDWEMIVIDDGSSDNTSDIVSGYLSDSRIHYFHKENGGVGTARNVGIRKAAAEFIVFLDSDDELIDRHVLDIMYGDIISVREKIGLMLYPVVRFSEAKELAHEIIDSTQGSGVFMEFSYQDRVCGNAWLDGDRFSICKKSIFDEYKFPEYVNGLEGILWSKISKEYFFGYHDIPLLRNNIHTNSLSRSDKLRDVMESGNLAAGYSEYILINEQAWKEKCINILGQNYYLRGFYQLCANNRRGGLVSLLSSVRYKHKLSQAILLLLIAPFGRWGIILARNTKRSIKKILQR